MSRDEQTSTYQIHLELDAPTLGRRTATVQVFTADHHPVDVDKVTVRPTMPDMAMNGPVTEAHRVDLGRYEAMAEYFTMVGDWRLTVTITNAPGPPESAVFPVTAKP